MASHSSTRAWKIPWTEEPGRLQSMGSLESDTTERLHVHFSLSCIGEGNGNPLQCSCLENPRDGEAQWAATYGVAQSWTRMKQLSSSNSLFLSIFGKEGGSDGKESACKVRDLDSIPRSERFPWKTEWLPTPVFLPGQFHERRSLVGYSLWNHKKSDTTEQLTYTQSYLFIS